MKVLKFYRAIKMPAKTSKYLRIYGMTLQQISAQLELSIPTTHALLSGKRKNYHPLTLKRFQWFLLEYAKKRIGQ
jgi:hypothetical protein